jgi:Uma2 family endonuclease
MATARGEAKMSLGMVHTIAYGDEKPRVIDGPMTYEEFLERDGDPHVEWVNGEAKVMAPISDVHDDLHAFLIAIMRSRVEAVGDGAVRHDPFQMKLPAGGPGRAPDLQYILKARSTILKPTYTDGPADLVVEIVSAGTRGVDRGDKFVEYEAGGVPEYWLLDPVRKQHEFYQLGQDGIYRPAAVPADGIYRSNSIPGLWIRVAWLNQCPLPTVLTVLKEWGIL